MRIQIFLSILISGVLWGCSGNAPFYSKDTEALFRTHCASCHMDNGTSRAPDLTHLGTMTPKSIVVSLETGKMRIQGDSLSREDKIALAEFITNQRFTDGPPVVTFCNVPGDLTSDVKYVGWGGNLEGTGFIENGGLTANQVPDLKLKWAFGFEGGTVTRSKPAIIGDHMIFGSQFGIIYCLSMANGCAKWVFEADAVVRGGIAINSDQKDIVAYAADFGANVYALDANTGELQWKVSVKNDPNNAVTGTPVYHDGMVYIPLTSMEVVTAGNDYYECCKSSGQVVAVNAADGSVAWRHRVVQEAATERGVNKVGAKSFGPSGAPVWSSPTVDSQRGLLYIGTGENNSNPPTTTSDAIQALDLKTGEVKWNYQATPKDAYISACADSGGANCPDPPGPDVDFGMAPILATRSDGTDVLVVGQKSGVVHCLQPDTGEVLWRKRIGRGGALGGIHWGLATDGNIVYATNSDWFPFGADDAFGPNPGVFALDILSGEVLWQSTSDARVCKNRDGCYNSNSAAPTLIPGVVFAGSLDGYFRAYDAHSGDVIWNYDTRKSYETVNGVEAYGGSIDGPGPVVANGMVFINSGYALFGQMPGNVLLAFGTD